MSEREAWNWGRKDKREGFYNPPPKLPEFRGADDLLISAYKRGWLGLKL